MRSETELRRPPASQRLDTRGQLRAREIGVAVVLASLSGAAILAHTFLDLPMLYTVPLLVLPGGLLLGGTILARRRAHAGLARLGNRVLAGAVAGIAATAVYDGVRWLMVAATPLVFDPFRAHPIFGALITGLPATAPTAITVGWIYHVWNGIGFATMFSVVRPQGGMAWGMAWGLGLEVFMIAAYPRFLGVRLSDPGLWATSLIGHACWGVTLGGVLAAWHGRSTGQRPEGVRGWWLG